MMMVYFVAMEEWFMLKYLTMQYIQYFFPKRAFSLHYSSRNTLRNFFIPACLIYTLAQLRNEYWIPQGRAEVKKAIHCCGICERFQGGPFKLPSMSPWPRKKVKERKDHLSLSAKCKIVSPKIECIVSWFMIVTLKYHLIRPAR